MEQLRGNRFSSELTISKVAELTRNACYFLIFLLFRRAEGYFHIESDCKNFVAGMTRRFVSAKGLVRYSSYISSELVEHRALSPFAKSRC